MLDRLTRFFKRFTSPKVTDKEVDGVKHVIDNIDHNFDPNRPTPQHHSGEHKEG